MVKGSCMAEEFRVSLEKKKLDEKVLAILSHHTFYKCDDRFFPSQHKSGKICVKGIRVTSVCEQHRGKPTLKIAWLAGKELFQGTTICHNWKTGQHSNLNLNNLIFSLWT